MTKQQTAAQDRFLDLQETIALYGIEISDLCSAQIAAYHNNDMAKSNELAGQINALMREERDLNLQLADLRDAAILEANKIRIFGQSAILQ